MKLSYLESSTSTLALTSSSWYTTQAKASQDSVLLKALVNSLTNVPRRSFRNCRVSNLTLVVLGLVKPLPQDDRGGMLLGRLASAVLLRFRLGEGTVESEDGGAT